MWLAYLKFFSRILGYDIRKSKKRWSDGITIDELNIWLLSLINCIIKKEKSYKYQWFRKEHILKKWKCYSRFIWSLPNCCIYLACINFLFISLDDCVFIWKISLQRNTGNDSFRRC